MSMPKKFKAVKLWSPHSGDIGYIDLRYDDVTDSNNPVYVLPATPEAYEAQIEAAANAHYRYYTGEPKVTGYTCTCYAVAEKMLRAIGITRPTKGHK